MKSQASNVKVICRFRPLNENEIKIGNQVDFQIKNNNTVLLRPVK